MGSEIRIRLFDCEFVEGVLAMPWPQFLRKHGFRDQQWESPEEFLWDFALDAPVEDDDDLPERIVQSWTLRRTARICSPQVFFIETVLECVRGAAKRCPFLTEYDTGIDFLAEIAMLRDAVIPAFLDRQVSISRFRAVMKIVDTAVGLDDAEIRRIDRTKIRRSLLDNLPKPAFKNLPAVEDEYTTLSAAETDRFLRVLDDGWTQKWPVLNGNADALTHAGSSMTLRDCRLVRELRNAAAKLKGRKAVLAYFYG